MTAFADDIPEDIDTSDDGEVIKTIKDVKKYGQEMIHELENIDKMLLYVQQKLQAEEDIDHAELSDRIRSVRLRIGVVKREEEAEVGEEKIAINLINKLRKWVQQMA